VTDERTRQRAEELCVATIRALSGDGDLRLRGGRLHRGRQLVPLHAPHLRPPDDDDAGSWRGVADGAALHLTESDPVLHRRLRPEGGVERLVFEMLEQFRVEALVPKTLPGVVRNLRHRHVRWSLALCRDGLTDTARGLLLYTVAQVCRSRITGEPVVADTEDLIEATRAAIAPRLGTQLAALRGARRDQAAFGAAARALAAEVAAMLRPDSADGEPEHSGDDDEAPENIRFALPLDFADEADGDGGPAALGRDRDTTGTAASYRVFTTAYDSEHAIAALVRPELLAEYRERLDHRIARQGVNVSRLARDLTAVLATGQRDGWDGAQEEGHVDGRALARLIGSPAERRLFRVERVQPVADVLVTFLIDCSGSMKENAERVAVLVDLFARALDLAGARSEILGFTTASWNGGRARKDWIRAGRPERPGRLNERRHLVIKDAETLWRRARRDIAGLLKADLFREGADGEALVWAAERARARDAGRKLLIVLSDGSPMDSATALANGESYLDQHLRDVVADLERADEVEVYGVGVGLDLSPYYSRCRVLDADEGTGYRAFRQVLDLLARPRR
jgi:cobaltochelatase CobT